MQSYFHIHLISDATGETLLSVSRAAAAQYANVRAIEHIYPLVRTSKQLDRVLAEIEAAPGIALYTLVDHELGQRLEDTCRNLGLPCVSILDPVLGVFRSYLGTKSTPRIGGQHVLDADYFKRIDALNFTIAHDDGQLPSDITEADVILVGISRTSKTPTSIYLANRGIKTANVPLVPHIPLPAALKRPLDALVVGLVATPERIVQIRRNRLLSMQVKGDTAYVDRDAVIAEIAYTRKLCKQHNWPVIDVTRRSIEETAAAVISLHQERKQHA